MPNPLLTLVDKHLGANFLPRLKQSVVGLAEDFWHDGTESPLPILSSRLNKVAGATGASVKTPPAGAQKKASEQNLWHAVPGEISEKMWGDGFVTPGGATIADALIKPLGLTNSMSVLDLSAGLGGRMRRTIEETGTYITGLEPDAGVAERGMELSRRAGKAKHAPIVLYDPAHLTVDRMYDCIIARETFYRVADKPAFFKKLGDASKPQAQIAFTDYIVDPENRKQPAIMAWTAHEKGSSPLGLVEMAEAWAKVGFSLRVNEDLSKYYAKEVASGLKRLAQFLGSGAQPDADTKKAILRRIETWTHRMAAMEQGMKFYRFYGTKQ